MTDPKTVAEMSDEEAGYSRAYHKLTCDEEPPGHPLEEHEPFESEEFDGAWDWPAFTEALREQGISLILRDDTLLEPALEAMKGAITTAWNSGYVRGRIHEEKRNQLAALAAEARARG